jgi:hypothetical protein
MRTLVVVGLSLGLSIQAWAKPQYKCVNQNNSKIACNETVYYSMLVSTRQLKEAIKKKYNYQSSVNVSAAKNEIDQYMKAMEDLKRCSKVLNKKPTPRCNISIYQDNKLSSDLKLRTLMLEVRNTSDGCAYSKTAKQASLINNKGNTIAKRYKYMWQMELEMKCKSSSALTSSLTRNINFGGYDTGVAGSKGYFQAIDWTDDSLELKVSNHWARQVRLGSKNTISYKANGSNLEFTWSNGQNLVMDISSGKIISSNFLDPVVYDANQCTTKHSGRGKRTKFYPNIKLISPYKKLPVKTIKG